MPPIDDQEPDECDPLPDDLQAPDPRLCPRCGTAGRQVVASDCYKPAKGETAELPPHLFDTWTAFELLERDEMGAPRLWTSGTICLDELGIAGREERLRWIGLWSAAAGAYAEAAEAAREAATSNSAAGGKRERESVFGE